ncbi:MAG: DUF6585 family protein [Tepidisphaerales bacterium]
MPSDTSQTDVALGRILIDDRFNAGRAAVISFIIAAVVITIAILAGTSQPERGQPGISPAGPAFFGLIGVGLAAIGVVMLVKGDRHTRIYEQGIEQHTKAGIRVLRFDDVVAFRCFIAQGKAAQIGFIFIGRDARVGDGGDIGWTAMAGPKMVKAEELRAYLTEMFAVRMLARLKAGSSVPWGQGQITPSGVELDGRFIGWKEITRVRIRNNGNAIICSSDQFEASLPINAANFWPGYAVLKRQLDPATFA